MVNNARADLQGQRRKEIVMDSLLYQQTRDDDVTKASFVDPRKKWAS